MYKYILSLFASCFELLDSTKRYNEYYETFSENFTVDCDRIGCRKRRAPSLESSKIGTKKHAKLNF